MLDITSANATVAIKAGNGCWPPDVLRMAKDIDKAMGPVILLGKNSKSPNIVLEKGGMEAVNETFFRVR